MFLEKNDQKMKEEALKELLEKIAEMDDGKGDMFSKKPVAAEVSVTELIPKNGEMEEKGEGEESEDMEYSGMSPSASDIAKIKELYQKFCV